MVSTTETFIPNAAMLNIQEIAFACYAAVCRMAMVSDPDGNTLCIHQRNQG